MKTTRLLPLLLLLTAPAWGQGLPLPAEGVEAEGPSQPGLETARFVDLPTRLGEHLQRNARRVRRAGGKTVKVGADTFLSPVFLGGILANDLARAGLEGDPDKAGDTLSNLNTPEFYASIGMFNVALRAGDGAWSTAAKVGQRAGLGSVTAQGSIGRISSAAVQHLRGNLVLAVALTLPRAVAVDFGGATFSEMIRGDFSNLNVSVEKGDWGTWDELAITLGSFAVAGPPVRALTRGFVVRRFAWPGLKKLFSIAGRRIAMRLGRTAAVKGGLAVAPVPGTRVAAAALTVGETVFAISELGAILFAAGEIEEPVTRWNDTRKMRDELNGAIEHLLTVSRDVGNNDRGRREDIQKDIDKLQRELDERYQKMEWELIGVAQGRIFQGNTGREVNKAYLQSVDPTELRTLSYVDLKFERAHELFARQVEGLLADLEGQTDRKRRERIIEQYLWTIEMEVGGRMRRFFDDKELTPEFLASVSQGYLKLLLKPERIRFGLTHLNFISSPHRLGADNFQRVVANNADKIIELHQKIYEKGLLLDPEAALDEALIRVAVLFADTRDYQYLEQAIEDETFLPRLVRWGMPREEVGNVIQAVIQDVSTWEAMPGQTVALRGLLYEHPGLPGRSAASMASSYERWLGKTQSRVRGIYARGNVSDEAITPRAREPKKKRGWGRLTFWKGDEDDAYHLADNWTISGNRRQLFEQEIRVYAEALELVNDPRLETRLGSEIAIVTSLRSLDDELIEEILRPDPEKETPEEEAPTPPRVQEREGITQQLGGR